MEIMGRQAWWKMMLPTIQAPAEIQLHSSLSPLVEPSEFAKDRPVKDIKVKATLHYTDVESVAEASTIQKM
jgi:hypothetical protein